MPALTSEFIDLALRESHLWDFGNEVLYKLCAHHPGHTEPDVIIAKFWLIGRSYSAAIERRRKTDQFSGDNTQFVGDVFYENLAPKVKQCGIDDWVKKLEDAIDPTPLIPLRVHKKLMEFLHDFTNMNNRSFASKYLHFHYPARFFIYDSRARKSVRCLTNGTGRRQQDSDAEYADFYYRCE